jgi:hypothetical protein
MQDRVWETRDGTRILVSNMTTDHINRCIASIECECYGKGVAPRVLGAPAAGVGDQSYQREGTMSDASLPHCERCGVVEYACTRDDGKCFSCGRKLDEDEIEAGRDQRFDCYCIEQG